MPTELRIRINEWMTDALYHLSKRVGMDYTNITRMALMEYLEKRLRPSDYESIIWFETNAIRDTIFEYEHYNRIIKKYPDKKAILFKKLFIVALQNYKKLDHTIFDKYKTNVKRFKEVIWKEPGVIDLFHFMTRLNEIPLPDKDQYEHLLKEGKEDEYYNKKWNEIYDNLKDRIGRKKHENYARLVELKIDYGLHTDTDAMYFLFEKLKNNEPLPPSSGQETKRLVDCSTIDEGSLEELIKKYGVDFNFIETEELEEIAKEYGTLGQIDYMIKYHQDGVKAYADQKDSCEFEKKQLKTWNELRKEFMESYQKKEMSSEDREWIGEKTEMAYHSPDKKKKKGGEKTKHDQEKSK